MCYIVKAGEKPKILSKDMTVYKVGSLKHGVFHPVYKNHFKYHPGVATEDVKLTIKPCEVELERTSNGIIQEGYHAFLKKRDFGSFYHQVLVARGEAPKWAEFVIPKGAEVYIDEAGNDIVASKIILKRVL